MIEATIEGVTSKISSDTFGLITSQQTVQTNDDVNNDNDVLQEHEEDEVPEIPKSMQ